MHLKTIINLISEATIMHIGFILTKSPSEQGFKTFIDYSQLYINNDQISIYLLGSGVYCASKSYFNPDLETTF